MNSEFDELISVIEEQINPSPLEITLLKGAKINTKIQDTPCVYPPLIQEKHEPGEVVLVGYICGNEREYIHISAEKIQRHDQIRKAEQIKIYKDAIYSLIPLAPERTGL